MIQVGDIIDPNKMLFRYQAMVENDEIKCKLAWSNFHSRESNFEFPCYVIVKTTDKEFNCRRVYAVKENNGFRITDVSGVQHLHKNFLDNPGLAPGYNQRFDSPIVQMISRKFTQQNRRIVKKKVKDIIKENIEILRRIK